MKKEGVRYVASWAIGLLLLGNAMASGSPAQGRELLEQALKQSRRAVFSAELKNPYPMKSKEQGGIPYAPEWHFYRLANETGIFLRVDTLRKGKLIVRYVKNASGNYGQAADGFAAQIIEVPQLYYPELSHLAIDPAELRFSSYSVTPETYQGIACYKIVMNTPRSEALLRRITGEDENTFNANRKRYRLHRAFVREFLVDRERLWIYSRRHFNEIGELIFSVEFQRINLNTPSPELFATPENLQGIFVEQTFFAHRLLETMIKAKAPPQYSSWKRAWLWFCRKSGDFIHSGWAEKVLLGIAIVSLLALGVQRLRKRRLQ